MAQLLAKEYGATYLRIDTIEQALREICGIEVQGEGYRFAYRIASDNLNVGHNVVADSCNPIVLTRREWEEVAVRDNCRYINIEVVCYDKEEHQRRCETRSSEVAGLQLQTWSEIQNREYDAWEGCRITIDTANKSAEESFAELKQEIEKELFGSIRL